MMDFIYLASQSPRRRQLLEQIGVEHRLLLPAPGEDTEALEQVLPGEAPASYVQRVTALKLDAALARLKSQGLPAAPVLCADTTVALGRDILGKPADAAEAQAMLARAVQAVKDDPAKAPDRDYSDIDLVRLVDGRFLAVTREHLTRQSVQSWSSDEGVTWTAPRDVAALRIAATIVAGVSLETFDGASTWTVVDTVTLAAAAT